ncbi:MAG: hypothetical protein P8Z49_09720 [Acidobacteriota bacterium]
MALKLHDFHTQVRRLRGPLHRRCLLFEGFETGLNLLDRGGEIVQLLLHLGHLRVQPLDVFPRARKERQSQDAE